MAYSDLPLATEEAIYAEMGGADFFQCLAIRGLLASAEDGAFSAFVLSSASVPLAAIGLTAGLVARFRSTSDQPEGVGWRYGVVDSVGAGSLTLRRPGQDAAVGQTFQSTGAGPWQFEVVSCLDVLKKSSRQVREAIRLTDDSLLFDPIDPEKVTRYLTVANLYRAAAKEATAADRDTYWTKGLEYAKAAEKALEDLLADYPGEAGAVGGLPVVFALDAGVATADCYADRPPLCVRPPWI